VCGQPAGAAADGLKAMFKESEIIVSSRLRLARNVKDFPFPGWASEKERVDMCGMLRAALDKTNALKGSLFVDMAQLQDTERDLLKERHLISNELSERGQGSGLVVSVDEQMAIMINEEDHLRMQMISVGQKLPEAWERLNALDSELENQVEYAFSPRLGYITACPSNVGTGLRASVMLHLPGLKLQEEVEPAINGLEKLGLAVRGLWGEGSEAWGNMFQVSNLSSLGESEEAIIAGMLRTIEEIVGHEGNARARLLESKKTFLLDQVGRALGVLRNARILSSREAIELLSLLRLGAEMDVVKHVDTGDVSQLMLLTQPGHLQKIVETTLEAQERDEMRAAMIRRRLGGAVVEE